MTSDPANMMGVHSAQKELFSYQVDLDRRVRADHPLRAIRRVVDFSFVRGEVAHCYGSNGHVSADPEVVLKLMSTAGDQAAMPMVCETTV